MTFACHRIIQVIGRAQQDSVGVCMGHGTWHWKGVVQVIGRAKQDSVGVCMGSDNGMG